MFFFLRKIFQLGRPTISAQAGQGFRRSQAGECGLFFLMVNYDLFPPKKRFGDLKTYIFFSIFFRILFVRWCKWGIEHGYHDELYLVCFFVLKYGFHLSLVLFVYWAWFVIVFLNATLSWLGCSWEMIRNAGYMACLGGSPEKPGAFPGDLGRFFESLKWLPWDQP